MQDHDLLQLRPLLAVTLVYYVQSSEMGASDLMEKGIFAECATCILFP